MNISKKMVVMTAAFALAATIVGSSNVQAYSANVDSSLKLEGYAVEQLEEVIFQTEAGFNPKILVDAAGGELVAELPMINGYIAKLPGTKTEEFSSYKGITLFAKNHTAISTTVNQLRIGKEVLFGNGSQQRNTHRTLIKADTASAKGKDVTVAVLDSGIGHASMANSSSLNVIKSIAINPDASTTEDNVGHGTHIAGIISGDDLQTGIEPDADVINVKLGNDQGELSEIDLLLGLQWAFDHKDEYNIKVVNLSVSSTFNQSYINSPISAAVEQLWLNGVIVVAAAGNDLYNPEDINYAPANDPHIITVGAVDGTNEIKASNTVVTQWSKRGETSEGVQKPEIYAPGSNIVSYLSSTDALLAVAHPDAVYADSYIQMSGTSMAAPVVSGAVALMLDVNPELTPNQIKYILTQSLQPTATPSAGLVDAEKAVKLAKDKKYLASLDLSSYNQWLTSEYFDTGNNTVAYSKAAWRSLDWLKVAWRSVDWAKAAWRGYWEELGK
jgi:serine protease AprX